MNVVGGLLSICVLRARARLMKEERRVSLCCPYCGAPLRGRAIVLTCPDCKRSFPVVSGIPSLANNQDYYYGGVTQSQMSELLRECKVSSWNHALDRLLDNVPEPTVLLNCVLGARRAAWWPLLALHPGSRVLSLGCGWGAVTFELARRVSRVVACDLTMDRLRFLQTRASQDDFENVDLICGGDTPRLPFEDAEFDLVVVNGVLEWIPTNHAGQPFDIQRKFLTEVARVLSPHGQVLLAIENRFSWLNVRGKPEDHVKIPYVSLLPRRLADIYSMRRKGHTYRTHTHSYWGYRKLLRAAGFGSARALAPVPDYRSFDTILDPERPATIVRYFEERGSRGFDPIPVRAKAATGRLFSPSFCWIASREAPVSSFLESLLETVIQQLERDSSWPPSWSAYTVSNMDVVICRLESDRCGPGLVLKLPLTESAWTRCESEHDSLSLIHRTLAEPGSTWSDIPVPFLRGEFRGNRYFVQEMLPGLPATKFLRSWRQRNGWKDQAVSFAVRLHSASREMTTIDEATWRTLLGRALGAGIDSVATCTRVSAVQIDDCLKKHLVGRTWPLVLSHGDYWPGNLLLESKTMRLTGVVDWDSSRRRSLPVIDLINALLFARAMTEDRWVPELVIEASKTGHLANGDANLVDEYLSGMNLHLTTVERKVLFLVCWLQYVGDRVMWRRSQYRHETDWIQNNVLPAAGWLKEVVSSA